MTLPKLAIIDDFYDDPWTIRRFALSLHYEEPKTAVEKTYFKGLMSTPYHPFAGLGIELIGRALQRVLWWPFPIGEFRLLLNQNLSDDVKGTWIHSDSVATRYAGLVYLNLPTQCEGGTSFYRQRDEDFEHNFSWGNVAGYYHFSIRNTSYMTPLQAARWVADQTQITPPVPLYKHHKTAQSAIDLPSPSEKLDGIALMRKRRSYRGFSDHPISLSQLGDCLYAGLAVTGFVRAPSGGEYLPLSMTPSGGGRNPYEAYVYTRNVDGLPPGTYHYSAVDHSLAPLNPDCQPTPGAVLAGQPVVRPCEFRAHNVEIPTSDRLSRRSS